MKKKTKKKEYLIRWSSSISTVPMGADDDEYRTPHRGIFTLSKQKRKRRDRECERQEKNAVVLSFSLLFIISCIFFFFIFFFSLLGYVAIEQSLTQMERQKKEKQYIRSVLPFASRRSKDTNKAKSKSCQATRGFWRRVTNEVARNATSGQLRFSSSPSAVSVTGGVRQMKSATPCEKISQPVGQRPSHIHHIQTLDRRYIKREKKEKLT